MKTKVRWRFLPILAGIITFAAFVGSISGSLAWWAYSTRVSVQYQGTSVATSVQLQIGLKTEGFDDSEAQQLIDLGMLEDPDLASGTTRYFFSKAGAGLPEHTIATYLSIQGEYSINTLYPVTSRQYKIGDELKLYRPLLEGVVDNTYRVEKNKYINIPFVFRVITLNENQPVKNQYIWLTHTNIVANSAESNVANALRLYFNNGSSRFIVNPTDMSTNELGNTKVFGLLDLNKDGYYDQDGSGAEIVYGQYTGTPDDIFNPTEDTLANINGVADESNQTSFYAKHQANKICFNSLSGKTTWSIGRNHITHRVILSQTIFTITGIYTGQ